MKLELYGYTHENSGHSSLILGVGLQLVHLKSSKNLEFKWRPTSHRSIKYIFKSNIQKYIKLKIDIIFF